MKVFNFFYFLCLFFYFAFSIYIKYKKREQKRVSSVLYILKNEFTKRRLILG
jgi:hypothetical protein